MMSEPFNCFHIVRNDFKTNFPKAYDFFKKYHVPNNEEAQVMGWIDKGMKPEAAAAKWIDQTKGKGLIEGWLA
jgi:glycine betaine/proline transport system substrate-binding protein